MAKRRAGSQIDSLTPDHQTSRITPISLHAGATYHWKALNEGYNFVLDVISIRSLHTKLWGPKVAGVPILAILGAPLESPGTKSHLDVGFMEKHKVYYKREGGGFPQVRAVVNLVSPNCPCLVLAPKVLQVCTNHLVLVLCRSV